MDDYEYGQPVPEKYRNRLFDWMGGSYPGCLEEPNAGLVDKDGHWHPLYSTGVDGIDDGGWFERQVFDLKQSLGYDCRDPRDQYNEKVYTAVKEVFGEEWYEIDDDVDLWNDPRVVEKKKADKEKLDTYDRTRAQLLVDRQKRLDQNFMMAFERSLENDRPSEIGLLDDAHLKETCALFCANYKGNVGFMAHVLDKLATFGYAPWCTCSDCGEQFRLCEYEKFGHLIDPDAYHGDGGIGVIMTRILCETCRSEVECSVCGEPCLPNGRNDDRWASDVEMYDLLASILYGWLGVCWACADGFARDHMKKWDESSKYYVETALGEKFDMIEEDLKAKYRETHGHALYEKIRRTSDGRKKINEIRDLLEDSVRKHFGGNFDDYHYKDRLDEKDPSQEELDIGKENENDHQD